MTDGELKKVLETLPLQEVSARVEGRPGHLVAEVCSKDFIGQDEATRQQTVWEHLLANLSDEQRTEVDIVVTLAPGESSDDPGDDTTQQ